MDPTSGRWDHEKIDFEMLTHPVARRFCGIATLETDFTKRVDRWDLQRERSKKQLVQTYNRGCHDLRESNDRDHTSGENRCVVFSRWLLRRRRRAMWVEELEEGIRKQDSPFTVCRHARLLVGTGIGAKHRRFGQIRACTLSQTEWAQGLAKEGPKGGLALHGYTWDRLQTIASGASGPS